ncbi:MAG: arginyltransferase [Deltaproteobacteria bacterium]|nr:arginyltransferase [Deltaproteobacteria bacterium]
MKPEPPADDLLFYATAEHECAYFADRKAVTLFADPNCRKSQRLYTALVQNGFRRSGLVIYRPWCRGCGACVACRVQVSDFAPRRSQRRAWQGNQDVVVVPAAAEYRDEYYELYQRYVKGRHAGGGMDDHSEEQFRDFLLCSWCDTTFYRLQLGERLIGVAVTDRLDDGMSAVYTFFDPDLGKRSLGVFSILWQIEEARRLGLRRLYLGYWIGDSPKMNYKAEYLPQERFIDNRWRRIERIV